MAAGQSDKTLTSPDGRLTVSVGCEDGKPVYGIEYDGITFMKPSPLGLKTNVGDFTSGMVMSRPEIWSFFISLTLPSAIAGRCSVRRSI